MPHRATSGRAMLHQLRFCVSISTSARAVRLWVSARPRPSLLVQLQQSHKHSPDNFLLGPCGITALGKGRPMIQMA